MTRSNFLFLVVTTLFTLSAVAADEHAVFDGRVYNGKFYPRVDIIEWTNPGEKQSHMEFQIYSKAKPVDIAVELEKKTGKNVMLVRYHIKERNEYVCRRVIAPGHFGEKFFVYKDQSDKDMDNFIISMEELPAKPGMALLKDPPKYAPCQETEERAPAAQEKKSEIRESQESGNAKHFDF